PPRVTSSVTLLSDARRNAVIIPSGLSTGMESARVITSPDWSPAFAASDPLLTSTTSTPKLRTLRAWASPAFRRARYAPANGVASRSDASGAAIAIGPAGTPYMSGSDAPLVELTVTPSRYTLRAERFATVSVSLRTPLRRTLTTSSRPATRNGRIATGSELASTSL